jgi:hypothetical protein
MKRIVCLTIVAVVLAGPGGGGQLPGQPPAQGAREDQEPPELFFLELGGKRVPIELGKPFQTDALGEARTATLRVEPYRVFQYAGLRFHYPREYTFEADFQTPLVALWTLSGTNCTIMVQRFNGQKDHEEALETLHKEMLALYKGNKVNQTPVKLSVKGKELVGKRLEVHLAGALLWQDLYSLPSGNDSIVLILQDLPQEGGKPSNDRTRAEKLFRETVQVPGK